jgi:hypothetical protein
MFGRLGSVPELEPLILNLTVLADFTFYIKNRGVNGA